MKRNIAVGVVWLMLFPGVCAAQHEIDAKPHMTIEEAMRTLHSDQPQAQMDAIDTLVSLGAKDKAAEIASLLNSTNSVVKMDAVSALGTLGATTYAPEIAKLLKDPERLEGGEGFASLLNGISVGSVAAQALGQLGAKQYSADIALLLTDKSVFARSNSAIALGKLHAREYAKQIAVLLEDQEAGGVITSAAFALGQLGAKEYAKNIADLLEDPDESVRCAAVEALGQMEAKEYASALAKRISDPTSCIPLSQWPKTDKKISLGAMVEQIFRAWGVDSSGGRVSQPAPVSDPASSQ